MLERLANIETRIAALEGASLGVDGAASPVPKAKAKFDCTDERRNTIAFEPSNIDLDEEIEVEAADPGVLAGGGSSIDKQVFPPEQGKKTTPLGPMEKFGASFALRVQDHDGQDKCASFKEILEDCRNNCGFPSLEDARAALLKTFQYKAAVTYTYVKEGTAKSTTVNGLMKDGHLQMLKK